MQHIYIDNVCKIYIDQNIYTYTINMICKLHKCVLNN